MKNVCLHSSDGHLSDKTRDLVGCRAAQNKEVTFSLSTQRKPKTPLPYCYKIWKLIKGDTGRGSGSGSVNECLIYTGVFLFKFLVILVYFLFIYRRETRSAIVRIKGSLKPVGYQKEHTVLCAVLWCDKINIVLCTSPDWTLSWGEPTLSDIWYLNWWTENADALVPVWGFLPHVRTAGKPNNLWNDSFIYCVLVPLQASSS